MFQDLPTEIVKRRRLQVETFKTAKWRKRNFNLVLDVKNDKKD